MNPGMHYGSEVSEDNALSTARRRSEAIQRKKEAEKELRDWKIEELKRAARLGITNDSTVREGE